MGASKAAVEGFAAGAGSLIALLTTYPLKTIYTLQAIRAEEKSRGRKLTRDELLQLATSPARLVISLIHDIDWTSLYAGLGPAAVETAASSAIYFYFYSLLRQAAVAANTRRRAAAGLASGVQDQDIGVLTNLAVAALAGAGNMLITTPAQVGGFGVGMGCVAGAMHVFWGSEGAGAAPHGSRSRGGGALAGPGAVAHASGPPPALPPHAFPPCLVQTHT